MQFYRRYFRSVLRMFLSSRIRVHLLLAQSMNHSTVRMFRLQSRGLHMLLLQLVHTRKSCFLLLYLLLV